jgi:hypothetical protein
MIVEFADEMKRDTGGLARPWFGNHYTDEDAFQKTAESVARKEEGERECSR